MVQQITYFSGEIWLGLQKLHQLTSENDYSLYVSLTDFDGRIYKAVYDHFRVIKQCVYDNEVRRA